MSLQISVNTETGKLDTVILGIAEEVSGPGLHNPKSEFHLEKGTYPTQKEIMEDIRAFETALLSAGVKVLRPQNQPNLLQLFVRDLGFVVGDQYFIAAVKGGREKELQGISWIMDLIGKDKIFDMRDVEGAKIEGGDVVLRDDKVFVGLSSRTNKKGLEALREALRSSKQVIPVELKVDEDDHRVHALHLDCVFQPLGNEYAIVFEDLIKDTSALYKELKLDKDNIFRVQEWQFVHMFPNILSVSRDTVIIESEFIELKYWLRERGFKVIEVPFRQISKMGGLLRCTTLPLRRF
jgi:N-dimethylarginine dimethylaminohydrolase